MRRQQLAGLMCAFASTFGACADGGADGLPTGRAPRIVSGADGVGVDAADTGCAVILRSVGRVSNGMGGYATSPAGLYVWDGVVDVDADVAAGARAVEVLFQTTMGPQVWYVATATRAVGEASGGQYVRYTFRIDTNTPSAGMSVTSLNRTVIRLIPYVAGTDGGRLFDHNRVRDVFDTYTLTVSNGWSVRETDAAGDACPAVAPGASPRWVFGYPAWEATVQGGPVRAGQSVAIAYDGRRLRETQGCMGAHGPSSATTLYVGWMVTGDPARGGSAEVERYVVASGYACSGPTSPCVTDTVSEPEIALPADASGLDVWFWCQPGFDGGNNLKYDSNQGANYHLAIVNDVHVVDWAGGWAVYRARPSDTIALVEPYVYTGFTNMGLAMQAEVYVAGLTDQAAIDTQRLVGWVESDAIACTPGGTPTRERLMLMPTRGGPYGNNAVFQWGYESLMGRCPRGDYRFRFVFSADGGLTTTTLGTASDTGPGAVDSSWRTFRFE